MGQSLVGEGGKEEPRPDFVGRGKVGVEEFLYCTNVAMTPIKNWRVL
jgi:hypothetical protein